MFRAITSYHLRWHKGKRRMPKDLRDRLIESRLMELELSYIKVNRTIFHSFFDFVRDRF